jgi:hypothetical protein
MINHKFIFLPFLLLLLGACNTNSSLPNSLKDGLLLFEAKRNTVFDKPDKKFGALWVNSGSVNMWAMGDTIKIDINTWAQKALNYDGACNFAGDTLYLLAKNLNKENLKDTTFSTFHYEILRKGRKNAFVKFKIVE